VAQSGRRAKIAATPNGRTETYKHPDFDLALRPEVGTQPQFRKKKPPATYRYDSSLSPSLEWDGKNSARELGEWLLACIEDAAKLPPPHEFAQPSVFRDEAGRRVAECRGVRDAVDQLKRLGRPFLNWAGKAERLSFDVPTLPLFVHERLSTMAIVETLKGHTKEAPGAQLGMFELFGDPQRSIVDQVLKAYEHGERDKWVNRMILGDSLVVMNSLLHYEGLGGQVQMFYIDPPYGVRFGSNFQPFVRKRDVTHNDDEDMTREPEMVKAYRDTWELGLHSWLTYLRDRLLVAHELLHPRGSVFVQINDTNVHYARQVLDEVFRPENFVSQLFFQTTSGFKTSTIATLGDFILWYARDKQTVKANKLFVPQPNTPGRGNASWVLLPDGTYRGVTAAEERGEAPIPPGAQFYFPDNLISQGAAAVPQPFIFQGKTYNPGPNHHWKANYPKGMERLAEAGRIHVARNSIRYRRFATDFPYQQVGNTWTDTLTGSFHEEKLYVVQTSRKAIERCVLLTTEPGDLILDPTCGSGWTAHVAEQWGRRWITIDSSRVPMALARQRLLTATFPWYVLKDESRGPAGGFGYSRTQNRKGEEIGGIVPHVELETIANDEPAAEELLTDRPDENERITRISGPFCVEATIPTPVDWDGQTDPEDADGSDDYSSYLDRMLDVLRRAPMLQVGGGKTVTLKNIRPPTKSLALSAEAIVQNGSEQPVVVLFGPENGAVIERSVSEAAREAHGKGYIHLYVIGFAIEANARQLIEQCDAVFGVPATYVQATPDLMIGDLLKTTRSSQIFSVCGLPDIRLRKLPQATGQSAQYEVTLRGLDVFDPVTMNPSQLRGDDVPAWMLDTDYNGLVFHGLQVFFPRTGAWEVLKKALRASHVESVWDHLAGTVSAPFEGGEHRQIAVKVIDDRGNELMVVKSLAESE
jgi:adenine-specific DNA-methyltransferase